MNTFHSVLLPSIIKYQAPSTTSPLGEYLLTLALNYSASEVWLKVFISKSMQVYELLSLFCVPRFCTLLIPIAHTSVLMVATNLNLL